LLGQVPLVTAVRQGGDEGHPIVAVDRESETAQAFIGIADRLASLGPARVYRKELSLNPTA
jgi:ATP-binding protein involved in chromosome partitioning